ncbi:uncharacterized protein FA14DRAFT_191994 [Meira miltonrushii]|uniref:Uncharacterized protein n=1 Tax=Meira miltonrushii TaxID=1280837 RepID=A0A316V5V3_9BASI|nr:uncharacterized protein FA14DRAFT_191994 [Meira miltonrushii]PWN32940.1 hypothetical protein FA14DRAFT_191994 [Meira miltonrushii]
MKTIQLFGFMLLFHNAAGWQGLNIFVKRTNSEETPRLHLDLNKSPPREPSPPENDGADPLMPTSQGDVLTSLKPRRPYVYYPRKQLHELSTNKKAIKARLAREKLREGKNENALSLSLEKQRARMEPRMERYRKETKELGYSNRPFTLKKRRIREKIRKGIATDEEREYIRKIKQKLSASPSQKKKIDDMKAIREKARQGTANEKELNALEKRKKADQETYQRRKQRKLNSDEA